MSYNGITVAEYEINTKEDESGEWRGVEARGEYHSTRESDWVENIEYFWADTGEEITQDELNAIPSCFLYSLIGMDFDKPQD